MVFFVADKKFSWMKSIYLYLGTIGSLYITGNLSYVIFDVLMNIKTIQYNLTTSGTYISNAPKKKPIAHSFMNLNNKLQE